jgi:Tripartite tricarboxylate transporter family receptor
MPANDLRELIAWLKANPDKASLGTNGPGSAAHLAGLLFQKETGTRFGFVPFRGRKSSRFHIAFIDHAFVRFLLAFDAILLFATVFWKRSDDLIFAVRPTMEKATAERYVLSGKKF